MLYVAHTELKARKWPLIIMFLLIVVPFIFLDYHDEKGRQVRDIFIIAVIAFIVIFYLVLSRLKIIIDNDGIELQMLLKKQRTLWQTIRKSQLSFEFHGHSGDVKWQFITTGKTLSFSPTFFSRAVNQQIAEALINKCPDAYISEKVRKMANGKFPWYIF